MVGFYRHHRDGACPSGPKSTPKAPTAAATALLSKKIEAVKFLIDDFADTTLLCSVPSAALKRFAPVVAPLVSVFVAIVMALASLSWGSL